MNTPTPTPRTDAAWYASFDGAQMSAGQTARALRECSQQLERELIALTTERDQLRSDCDNETKWAAHYLADALAAKARAERAEAAETVALANWNGALERALKAEADLATELARLDWLESDAGVDWQWSSSALTIRRAVIDAAMKEDAQ